VQILKSNKPKAKEQQLSPPKKEWKTHDCMKGCKIDFDTHTRRKKKKENTKKKSLNKNYF